MRRVGIPARQGQSGSGDTLGEYRARMAALGATASAIRSWAMANDVPCPPRAAIPLRVLDLYESHLRKTA